MLRVAKWECVLDGFVIRQHLPTEVQVTYVTAQKKTAEGTD